MIHNILKNQFGLKSFQGNQEKIIQDVVCGNDVLVLMPTGGGKSLCYQVPALCFSGITIVVSPLISLMKDQVDSLKAKGIQAELINSTLKVSQIVSIKARIRRGEIKLLYVSPERLLNPRFLKFMSTIHISLIAIDEAHCVSQWGHDFRPEYLRIKEIRKNFPHAGMMALTATATIEARADILLHLGLKNPNIYIGSFNRPNLYYSVQQSPKPFEDLLFLIGHEIIMTHALGTRLRGGIIIYCHSRKDTIEMARSLKLRGFTAMAYHAGLDNKDREAIQECFLQGSLQIITATSAFGMGINKPNVRLVVHFCLPASLEAYYQETGRAGRDGSLASCILFYKPEDNLRHDVFMEDIKDPQHAISVKGKLVKMIGFCETTECRRKFILEYFGEKFEGDSCRNCDNCLKSSLDQPEIPKLMINPIK